MKKSTTILFILAAVFAGASTYLAFQNRDLLAEKNQTEQELAKQKEVKSEVYDLNAKNKTAELELSQLREKKLKIEKELAEANERALNQQKALDDAGKKLADQEKATAEKENTAKSALATAEKDKATIEELQKKLTAENKRAEELNGEVVKLRSTTGFAEKEKAIADISREREELLQELAANKLEVASLKQQLQAQLSNKKDLTAATDARLDEVTADLEAAEGKIKTLEQTIRTLRQRLANR